MIPYGHQFIDKKDIENVVNVLKSDFLTQGPKVKEFEDKLSKYTNSKYCLSCTNGTSALLLSYMVCEFKSGDEVITTPNSFVATTNMLFSIGVKPVFCDIRLDTYNIDENKIEKLITKKTKAIIPVHFAGNPCEMQKIYQIAKKYNLKVIEDAAQALGAKYKNSKIGSCKYSDITITSFHPVKSITTGEGGAIFTNNKKYYEKLLLFRNHGIYKDIKGKNVMVDLSANYRMTDIQAALGISQLDKINTFIKKRHQIVNYYYQELKNCKDIILPQELKNNYSACHIHVIRVKNPKLRDELSEYLKINGVGVNFHYPAIYSHPYYRKNGYKNIKLGNEDIYQNSCITLPCHTLLKKDDVQFIATLINSYFIKNKYRNKNNIKNNIIYLKLLSKSDVSLKYCKWLNDPEVNKYLETRKCNIKDLNEYVQKRIDDPNSLFFGIFDKKNNKHIGNVKLEPIDWKNKKAIFGILIGDKGYWNKGIGTMTTKMIIDFAFNILNLNELQLGVISENKQAIRVYEKVGFKISSVKKKSLNHNGKLYDNIIMIIKK